jgi:hypothetical protein
MCSESYVATDSQPASLSVLASSPILRPRLDSCYSQTFVGLVMWGPLSDQRTGLFLQLLLVLARAVILGFECRGTHDHILLSQIRDSSNLEGQVPVFIYPRNRVAQFYPQTLDSLLVASYDFQG